MRLFLDYDGTLAEFALTPDEIYPDSALIDLLQRLMRQPNIQIAIISGRRLSHIQQLIPLSGLILAGTYGIEMIDLTGKKIERVDYEKIRPALDRLKPQWLELIQPYQGFYLEDKGWSLALHAKFADPLTAEDILQQARKIIHKNITLAGIFRILGGHRFLEIAPLEANKGRTIEHLISHYPLEGSLPVYIGDDDKDEEAFAVILKNGGIAIKVCKKPCATRAQLRLKSPSAVRQFLGTLLS